MNPVIRIPDRLYERLQRYARPFEDTPASVIERLVTEHEQKRAGAQAVSEKSRYDDMVHDTAATGRDTVDVGLEGNLFLVPGVEENIKASIDKTVGLSLAKEYLPEEQLAGLTSALGARNSFYCWATTQSSVSEYREMHSGDIAVLTTRGSGLFTHYGKIIYKFVSEELSRIIWPVVVGYPWKYMYVFGEIHRLSASKRKLVSELGYQSTYVVPGITRVKPSMVARIISRYGSVEGFLKAMDAK